MDSLTQIVLGASVGEAVLGKKVGNKAALFGAIAGTIPDLDVLSRSFTDTVTAIEWHRGFSHSLLFSLLCAPVLGGLVYKLHRGREAGFKEWTLLFFWGLFTHPILDAFTTWGTQLFWPLNIRLAFQSVFVIDPLYTLPFLLLLLLALRQKRDAPKRAMYNKWALMISSGYLLGTLVLKGVAYRKFENSLEEQGVTYLQMDTRPTPMNTLLWTANVDVGDAYLIGYYSFFDTENIEFRAYPKHHDLLGDLAANDKVKRMVAISEGWYTLTSNADGLVFNDLRFGLMSLQANETRFAFSYRLLPGAGTLEVEEIPKFRSDGQTLLQELWNRIWGN